MIPFFSIIIPSYNRADFIKNTIESVQFQTFENWECIVVDDGSIDNTREIIEALIIKDSRIKYIYQNNAERSAARNNGIKNAQGKYVCFLDSDDSFEQNHLNELYNEIELKRNPIALFFTNYIICQNEKKIPQIFPKLGDDVIDYLFYNPIIPARVCIHSKILNTFNFDEDIVIVEDLLLWIKIALKYPLFHIEKETVIYNLHEDNSINIKNNSALKRLNGIKLFINKYPEIKNEIPKKMWDSIIGDSHFNLMKYYLYNKSKKLALKHLIISLYRQKRHHQLKHKLYVLFMILFNRRIIEYES